MRSVELIGPRGVLRCSVPTTRRERARGLIGNVLADGEALLLERCTSVHTFGMRRPIVVARLSRSYEVRDVRVLPPNRFLAPTWRRGHVLECAADADVRSGDVLRVDTSEPVRPGTRRGPRPR